MKKPLLKNAQQESQLILQRTIACAIFIGFFCVLLLSRLIHLQLEQHARYSTLSEQNLLNLIPIEPNRGLIYDRNGILLAQNRPAFSLDIIPGKVPNLKETLAALNQIIPLNETEIKVFNRAINQHRHYDQVPLKMNLNEAQVATFYVNQYRFPGVLIQSHLLRIYPLGELTGEVVGYVGRINPEDLKKVDSVNYSASNYIGKNGIEEYFESILHGTVGAEEAEINARGQIVRVLRKIPPVAGKNLYLTIDSKLQAYAETLLGDNSGSIVVIQPKTGEILAMVTHPSFDPNVFVNGISQKAYQALLEDPEHPLYNRAIRGIYSPGSTIKPFWAIAGLENNTITPQFKLFDQGFFRLPNTEHVFHDWGNGSHGWVNVVKAITVSCDIFFYTLASKMGIYYMDHFLAPFGFGQITQVDMPDELSGTLPSPDWKRAKKGQAWYKGDTIEVGIGQGFLSITPLQLAHAVTILATHGQRIAPHVLASTEDANSSPVPVPLKIEPPIILKNPNNWEIATEGMEGVIDSPMSSTHAYGPHPGYLVAGKTGTASIFKGARDARRAHLAISEKLRDNHLFISFAPVDNPKIAIAIVVEHAIHADKMAGDLTRFYLNPAKTLEKSPK